MCLMTLTVLAPVASAANTQNWTYGFPMGAARSQATVVQDTNGVVYYMHGVPTGGFTADGLSFAFNPGTGTWISLTSSSYWTRGSSGALIDGKIYVLSGYRDTISAATPITKIYDMASNSWSYTGAGMPVPVWEAKSFVYGDRIIVVGGESPVDDHEDIVQIYNTTSDAWSTGTNIPKGLIGGATVTVGAYGYYIGGENASAGVVSDVYRYDILHNSWMQMASLPGALCGNIAITGQDDLIYSIGGEDQMNNIATIAYGNTSAYNIGTNSWTVCDELNEPRCNAGAALYDNKVIVLGGNDDVDLTATVEMLDTTQSQNDQLQAKLNNLQTKLDETKALLDQTRTTLNQSTTDLQDKIAKLTEDLNQTQSELNDAIDAANNNANSKAGDAKTAADSANMMALIGIIVGIIGIVIAIVAVMMAMKKGKGPQQMVPQQGQVQQ